MQEGSSCSAEAALRKGSGGISPRSRNGDCPPERAVVYAPFSWQETGIEHHATLGGTVQIIFAHGVFMAKRLVRDDRQLQLLGRLAKVFPSFSLPEFAHVYGTVSAKPSNLLRGVITEVCPVTLQELIHTLHFRPSRELLASLMMDIANAVNCLHQRSLLHLELCPQAILVTENCAAKLGDLGVPPTAEDRRPENSPRCPYLAPEVLQGGSASPASDVYSFGVTVAELATGMAAAEPEVMIRAVHWPALQDLLRKWTANSPECRCGDFQTVLSQIRQLLSSLDVQPPYNLSAFKRVVCEHLSRTRKLAYFPSLFWTHNAMTAEDFPEAAKLRGPNDPELNKTIMMILRRLSQLEGDPSPSKKASPSSCATAAVEAGGDPAPVAFAATCGDAPQRSSDLV
eukprot:RCo005924